jgi:SAM-dependent methyltransferase
MLTFVGCFLGIYTPYLVISTILPLFCEFCLLQVKESRCNLGRENQNGLFGKNLEVEMTHIDVYGRTHELDANVLDVIATRLEARRGSQRYMSMLFEYLDLLDFSAHPEILFLGCGTGVEVRELLSRPNFNGNITALDISQALVERGQSAFAEEGIGSNVRWLVGDAQDTRLPDQSFDMAFAHTLISHVPSPEVVVSEIARLLKPGGTAIIFDGDYATLTYGTDDTDYGKEMDEKIIRGLIANPRIMRSMPRMFRRAGLKLQNSLGWVLTEIGHADFFLPSLDSLSALLPAAGVASSDEVEKFVEDQRKAHAEGTFFAGYNFYAMIAQKE